MSVVSVINYKGGVGKTTLTANIGAELAARGRKVLLIDLDPQASLTFSFYRPQDFTEEKLTILQWYQGFINQRSEPLPRFVLTPREINAVVQPLGGQVHLLPAHLGLIEVDLDLAAMLGGARFLKQHPRYLPVHRALADALLDQEFAGYDSVLIDCAPNFNMVTRTAIVASDHVVVPARPDYLSTLGIDYLRARLSGLVEEYNSIAPHQINPELVGVIYTMVQWTPNGQWLAAQRTSVETTTKIEIPVFRQSIRDSKTSISEAGTHSLPVVLAPPGNTTIENLRYELQQLTSEFLARTRI
ncbi:ParA family protein [Dactylosporangium sp. AC04546]|uniref:ParA family protein n=1 Tax=Dactylosporangium sp. AC04546 TaxID=2862460 RepID=UPI001EE092AE|nr:ParA family protein [Dactylosporangium sp. AC04546]WVK82353.1 ParA family protein [Dactylosporangium sp. AC04546]